MLTNEHIDDLLQHNGNVLSTDGEKIGSVGQVYADDTDGQLTWVGRRQDRPVRQVRVFRRAAGARLEGDDIVVPYPKDPSLSPAIKVQAARLIPTRRAPPSPRSVRSRVRAPGSVQLRARGPAAG